MELTLINCLALVVGGFIAGIINAVAGGGSLIALPILIFAGLPPLVANGTNRVAVVVQCVTGSFAYAKGGKMPWEQAKRYFIPLLVGTLVGAFIASNLSNQAFKPILGVLMLLLAGLLLLKPQRWLHPPAIPPLKGAPAFFVLLLVGVHAGFIQAGVGFTMLAALVLGFGLDLLQSNALKLLMVIGLAGSALLVFALNGQVDWAAGGILAVGNGIGGYMGARLAIKKGAPWIRWFMIITVVVSAIAILRM